MVDDDQLRLVGPFCDWKLETKGLLFQRVSESSVPDWQEHHLNVRLDCPSIEFQIVSERRHWDWRVFPRSKRYGFVAKTGTSAAARLESVVGGANDGHNHNFQIQESTPKVIKISVWLKGATSMDSGSLSALLQNKNLKARVSYSLYDGDPQVVLMKSGVQFPVASADGAAEGGYRSKASSSDECPLRLVGPFCSWKLDLKGLELKRVQDKEKRSGCDEHRLCARLHSGKLEFQVVSSAHGYRWRLFPKGKIGNVPRTGNSTIESLDVVLGGSDDGEHHNFRISEEPFTVVTISICLQDKDPESTVVIQPGKFLRASVSYSCENTGLQVAVLAASIQYPPKALDFLRADLLKQASPELLEQRMAFLRKVCWQTQREYAEQRVQEEVLALITMFMEGAFLSPYCQTPSYSFGYYPLKTEAFLAQCKDAGYVHDGEDPVKTVPISDAVRSFGQSKIFMLRDLWSALTSDKGPLDSDTWAESNCAQLSGSSLPVGGLFRANRTNTDGKRRLQSPMELWSFLCRCSASYGLLLEQEKVKLFNPPGCLQDVEDTQLCQKHSSKAMRLLDELHSNVTAGTAATAQQRHHWKLRALAALCDVNKATADVIVKKSTNEAEIVAAHACRDTYEEAYKLLRKCMQNDNSLNPSWQARVAYISDGGLCGIAQKALPNLPAVQAARNRTMKAVGLEATADSFRRVDFAAQEALAFDSSVHESQTVIMKRLRLVLSPLPSVTATTAHAIQEHRIYSGSPDDYFGGMPPQLVDDATTKRVLQALEKPRATAANTPATSTSSNSKSSSGRFSRISHKQFTDYFHPMVGTGANPKEFVLYMQILTAQDHLQNIVASMGSAGKGMKVETSFVLANIQKGEHMTASEGEPRGQGQAATLAFTLVLFGQGTTLLRFCTAPEDEFQDKGREVMTLSSTPFNWVCYNPQHFVREVTTVHEAEGVSYVTFFAVPSVKVTQAMPKPARKGISEYSQADSCQSCRGFAGEGVVLPCPQSHRLCHACFKRELRKEPIPTCPVCANDKEGPGRIAATSTWDCLCSTAITSAGCICADTRIDPGARVVILDQGARSGLTGRFAEALWWDIDQKTWEVHVFSTGEIFRIPASSLRIAATCPPKSPITSCPCWPAGRGLWPVSLGNRCIVKMGIDKCSGPADSAVGYPYFHGADYQPFDSLVTRLEAILFFLRHDFRGFYDALDTTQVQVTSFSSRLAFDVHRSWIHSFPHHDPVADRAKFQRRIQRFRLLCKHSRDAPGARTLLFIRFLGDSSEFGLIDETYATVRLHAGGQSRLIFICQLQSPEYAGKVYRHERFPRVFIYLVGEVLLIDYRPIGQACRLAVMDEAGLLDNLPTISVQELQRIAVQFDDPYTQGWMLPLEGQDPAFFHDGSSSSQSTKNLIEAAQLANLQVVSTSLTEDVDVNAWDEAGYSVLHHVAIAESEGESTAQTLDCVADLLLAHADPGCHDKTGRTVVEFAQNMSASLPVQALLAAAAASSEGASQEVSDAGSAALYMALEALREPRRSRLARVLGVGALCGVHKCPQIESLLLLSCMTISHLRHDLRGLERFPSESRKRAWRELLRRWHPDRNPLKRKHAVDGLKLILAKRAELLRC